MQLSAMLRLKMSWTRAGSPRSEVVVSSRIRLARCLRSHPFPGRSSPKTLAAALEETAAAARKTRALGDAACIRLSEIDAVDRLFLIERHLISRNLAETPQHRAVVVGEQEVLSLMINEEDSLRMQGIDAGLCLEDLLVRVSALDDELAASLDFASHPQWGYLTACPTNVGTGLRASCLVHLPGLGLLGEINPVLEKLSGLGVSVRGLYGEGTKVMGDFYQISNASTLGPSEEDFTRRMTRVVESLAESELRARKNLAKKEALRLEDLVYRSLGTLQNARFLPYEEALHHLSLMRLALSLGWRVGVDMGTLNEWTALARPGHLQMREGRLLQPEERDALRAGLLRDLFNSKS
ncbi:MAG: ATP--guanido phosphotransferase [Elusimicrobiota bacterium]|jgi:protein arginine kinase